MPVRRTLRHRAVWGDFAELTGHVYLRLLHVLMTNTAPGRDGRRHVPLRIALDGDERRNVVPVDWVSKAVCSLLDNPSARGKTFHLAPRTPITPRDFFDAAYRYFNAYGYEFRGRDWQITPDRTLFEEAFLAHGTPYAAYELTDPRFDRGNLDRCVQHLPCHQIDETVLHRYLSFGEEDRWGKRPPWRAKVHLWTEDLLRQILSNPRPDWPTGVSSVGAVGLDIMGPGGGQWQLTFDAFKPPSIRPGLPPLAQPVYRLSADKLARLLGGATARAAHFSDPNSPLLSQTQGRRGRRLLRRLVSHLIQERLTVAAARRAA